MSTVGEAKAMTVNANASRMFFRMYIKNTYSNQIGSVVREITSNCFDSHIEAGVNKPIIIRKGEDENSKQQYISFIDFGVGLSPKRMDEVYTVLLTSTKLNTNDQIGGFGLGSKTPLAYIRQLAYGSGESDNSFFVITISEGIKYTYLVYEGKESPMLSLLHSEECLEHNGTEVRVPILGSDLYKFENEIIRQLYYFDSIIFENFDNRKITNDYQILRADNFLYRGNDYSQYMHISLGKVSYPINYNVLGLEEDDYKFPVAINFNIGDINVVTSREAIDYSDSTIQVIKKRLKEAKAELLEMLVKQHDNVVTLTDYYKFRENFNELTLIEGKTVFFNKIEFKDIKLNNFIYKNIDNIPKSNILFDILYRDVEYTLEKSKRRRITTVDGTYSKLEINTNTYIWDGYEFAQKRNVKINFLKYKHKTFHLITKRKFTFENIKTSFTCNNSDLFINNDDLTITHTKLYDNILSLLDDYNNLIESKIKKYDDIIIPESYLDSIKKKRSFIKGSLVINIVGDNGYNTRETIEISELSKFKGTIVFGSPDDVNKIHHAVRAFTALFSPNIEVVRHYSKYNGFSSKNFDNKKNKMVMFIHVAKNNTKKLNGIGDSIHVDQIYNKFFHRKENDVLLGNYLNNINDRLLNINSFYLNPNINEIYPTIRKYVEEIKKVISDNKKSINLNNNYAAYYSFYEFSKFIKTKEHIKLEKMLSNIEYINELNTNILKYFKIETMVLSKEPALVDLLKKSLVSETF
jgi:hypothetical protein